MSKSRYLRALMTPVIVILVGLALTSVARADPFLITFGEVPEGTAVPFSITESGTAVQFSASVGGTPISGTNSFVVIPPSNLVTLTGEVLVDGLFPTSPVNQTLMLAFSTPQTFISLLFATEDFGAASPFTLTAFSSGSEVASVTTFGSVPPGGTFPEGSASLSSPVSFDSLTVSSEAPYFAIDDVTNVPEPSPALMLLSGLLVLIVASRRVHLPGLNLLGGILARRILPNRSLCKGLLVACVLPLCVPGLRAQSIVALTGTRTGPPSLIWGKLDLPSGALTRVMNNDIEAQTGIFPSYGLPHLPPPGSWGKAVLAAVFLCGRIKESLKDSGAFDVRGIAADTNFTTTYVLDGSNLYTYTFGIGGAAGTFTLVGALGLPATFQIIPGSIWGEGNPITILDAIAESTTGGTNQIFVRINTATGKATKVGTDLGVTGLNGVVLANQIFWSLQFSAIGYNIFTINSMTGKATATGKKVTTAYAGGIATIQGIGRNPFP